MSMPKLDPARYVNAYLGNPAHTLPIPGTMQFFPADGRVVDNQDDYWALCLADGSLTTRKPEVAPPPLPPAPPATAPEPEAFRDPAHAHEDEDAAHHA